ncbi:hypothetical protein FSP39_011381 [Pinctada imbricata]|uniref:Sulfotransferase domain-containing protein n=1 Tax=Pinctada imbricata TaxID=66713 RepID=A0AA88XW20_PINIB|nr:hypothetical protein FSP39_011381 [Pinctada imbricata]
MPEVKLTDKSGATITALDIDNGYIIPTFKALENHEQHVLSMPTWNAENDDILICAYPKSGTHWLWEVTCMLLKGKAERIKRVKEDVMIEGMTKDRYEKEPVPRVFNTHILFKYLPEDFRKKRCKILYVLRNPKDVAVSYYNHHSKIREYEYDGKWEPYLDRYIEGNVDYGSWFDYTVDWERVMKEDPEYPVHMMYYEDMKENGMREIQRLAKFLEVDRDEKFIREVDELCQFDRMKKDKDKIENADEWKNGQPGMYRKGQVGDWKNWFTVSQSEKFDVIYDEKMKNSNVKIRFTI